MGLFTRKKTTDVPVAEDEIVVIDLNADDEVVDVRIEEDPVNKINTIEDDRANLRKKRK